MPGAAAWLVVSALTPTRPNPFEVAGAYAFAWTLGFVIVLAPSGLGVREATFIALLGSKVGVAPATLVAVALRLASILGELLAFGLVEVATFAAGHLSGSCSWPRAGDARRASVPNRPLLL